MYDKECGILYDSRPKEDLKAELELLEMQKLEIEHHINYIKDYLENRIKSIYLEAEKEQIMEVVEFCDAHCDDGHFDKEGAIANIKSTFNL